MDGFKCVLLLFIGPHNYLDQVTKAFFDLFLNIEDQSFENWLPFLSKYANSSVARLSPEYFLGYLLKKAGVHPKKCLQLVKNYKTYKKTSKGCLVANIEIMPISTLVL
jgi:hypothetical protein